MVEEAVNAGIQNIAIVVSEGMEPLIRYFKPKPYLVQTLKNRGAHAEAEQQEYISDLANISFIHQDEPLGLGHAVMLAREWIGNEPFAVFLPDDIVWAEMSVIRQLMKVRDKYGGQVIAVKQEPEYVLHTKGVIKGKNEGQGIFSVQTLVEKPKEGKAPSNLAIIGRYLLEPSIFDSLALNKPVREKEIQITDSLMRDSVVPLWAKKIEGIHADTGTASGMLKAALIEAKRSPNYKECLDLLQNDTFA